MDNSKCPCKKKGCERHGKCKECREHHANSKRQKPVACEREKKHCRFLMRIMSALKIKSI